MVDQVREWFTDSPTWLVVGSVALVVVIVVVSVWVLWKEGDVEIGPLRFRRGPRKEGPPPSGDVSSDDAPAEPVATTAPGPHLVEQAVPRVPSDGWRRNAVIDHKEEGVFGVDERIVAVVDALQASDPPLPVSVVGGGGIGKTVVAYEAAKRCAASGRFSRIAWVSAKGSFLTADGERSPRTGVDATTAAAQLDDMAKVLATHLGATLGLARSQWQRELIGYIAGLDEDERLLVVLDNVENATEGQEAVAFLQSLGLVHPHRLLVTTRQSLRSKLPSIPQFPIQPLDVPDALALVAHLGQEAPDLLQADAATLQPILDVTGCNPYLIKLVVRHYVSSGRSLAMVLDELTSLGPDGGLGKRAHGHLYQRSLKALSDGVTVPVADALMGAFCAKRRGETFTYEELEDNAEPKAGGRFGEALELACGLSLVTTTDSNRRYAIHSLLYEYTCQEP